MIRSTIKMAKPDSIKNVFEYTVNYKINSVLSYFNPSLFILSQIGSSLPSACLFKKLVLTFAFTPALHTRMARGTILCIFKEDAGGPFP